MDALKVKYFFILLILLNNFKQKSYKNSLDFLGGGHGE
jgi:hypothetical protein